MSDKSRPPSQPQPPAPAAKRSVADEDENHHDDDDDQDHDDDHHDDRPGDGSAPARKRQRVRLSCLECRRRKLSCSRDLPCDRCLKSGTPERCNYETRPGAAPSQIPERSAFAASAPMVAFDADLRRSSANSHIIRRDLDVGSVRDHDRIRKLELEVAQLKGILTKQGSIDGSTMVASPATLKDLAKETPPEPQTQAPPVENGDGLEIKYVRGHNFKARYIGSHSAWSSVMQLAGITPFMKETADEWLRPLRIQVKDRKKRKEDRDRQFLEPDLALEALLPSREETDSLVSIYLDQYEQIHRIIHVPTFKQGYATFWDPSVTRAASFTALVMAMIAVSSCLDMQVSNKFVGVKSSSWKTAEKWIKSVDEWNDKLSQKHRKLIHYQIICMLYLAKKVNVIKKKRFWTNSGAMIRDGIIVGLHQDPDHVSEKITPYYREMRRRLWASMVEFDIQSSLDQGVPTLMSQIYNDAEAPRNINDEEFDDNSTNLPPSRPSSEYTYSSYQHFSHQSLSLRLELTRVLTGPIANLDWEQVQKYTELIAQEIDALPSWNLDIVDDSEGSKKPILAHSLLHLQLRQYLIPLTQPYLKLREHNSKYQTAEFVHYNAARDIILMHDSLFQRGYRALYFLREDTMNAAVNLCNVSLLQPRNSSTLLLSNAEQTIKLIEKAIAMKEDRILRCGNNDPWGYSSMCAALGLLETHLGTKTTESAKAASAERFLGLHYKLLAYQVPPFASSSTAPAQPGTTQTPHAAAGTSEPFIGPRVPVPATYPLDGQATTSIGASPLQRDGIPASMPWLLPQQQQQTVDPSSGMAVANPPDFDFAMLGTDLNELWGEWPDGAFS